MARRDPSSVSCISSRAAARERGWGQRLKAPLLGLGACKASVYVSASRKHRGGREQHGYKHKLTQEPGSGAGAAAELSSAWPGHLQKPVLYFRY